MESGKALVIDSHFHIWDLQKFAYPWPTEDLPELYRNFSIDDYAGAISESPVRCGIFVQVLNGNLAEIDWLMDQAKESKVIGGIIGGVDLTDHNLQNILGKYASNPSFVGVRHILDMEADDWLLRPDVLKGLKLLEERGLVFDLLVRPKHLKYAIKVTKEFPKLTFVVNHISKPLIKDGIMEDWKTNMSTLAKCPNVCIKLSGLVVEADWDSWKVDDFRPYIQHVLSVFGADRCLFGSDWPVCLLAKADYSKVYDLLQSLISHLAADDQAKILGLNAIRAYNLKIDR